MPLLKAVLPLFKSSIDCYNLVILILQLSAAFPADTLANNIALAFTNAASPIPWMLLKAAPRSLSKLCLGFSLIDLIA